MLILVRYSRPLQSRVLRDRRSMMLTPANGVTALRALLVAAVAMLISRPPTRQVAAAALALAVVAAVLDGVDGWLARRTGTATAFGARFDMETDALMILVLSILVWRHGKAGVWVLAGGLMRYAFGAAAWMLPWMNRPLTPTRRAKTVKVAHDVGLCAAIAPIVPWPLSALAVGATTIALTWSFAVAVRRLYRGE
jgi:phosphatidylglycerophosphate synthase